MKFQIDEYVCDVLIDVGCGSENVIPDALRSGFHEIYRIESSAARYAVVHDAVRLELECSPCSTKVMLYSGPVIAALNQACENSQNKSVAIHLKRNQAGINSDMIDDDCVGILEQIRVVRRWFFNNIIHPVVIVSDISEDIFAFPVADLINELLDLCGRYYFQIFNDGLQRNVLVAVPPVWLQAYAGALNNQATEPLRD